MRLARKLTATLLYLLAVAILGTSRPDLRQRLEAYRREMADAVRGTSLP